MTTQSSQHVIEVSELTKDYGSGRGVFDVSIYVDKGEVFGFLGPNGAGKSTTIRHLQSIKAKAVRDKAARFYPEWLRGKINLCFFAKRYCKIRFDVI